METKDIVYVAIYIGQRLLITKRSSDVHENIWEFPDGKVKSEETREQVAAREIREELELCMDIDRYLTTIHDSREDCTLLVHAYLYRCVRGEIHLHAYHEYALVTPRELYSYQLEVADQPVLGILQENAL